MCNSNPDNGTALNNPIKVRWTGVARDRLGGWALDFANADEDNGMEHYVNADSRQKTNVVIETVEEAEAVAGFMNKVIGEGGNYGRTWVNGSVDKAGQRVRREIVDAMAERGFEVSNLTSVYGLRFEEREEPDVTVEEGDTVIDKAHDKTGNVTGVDGTTVHVEFTNGVTSATTVSGLLDESNPWDHVPAGGEDNEEDEERLMTDGGVDVRETGGPRVIGECSLLNRGHEIPIALREALESLDVAWGAAGCNGCAGAGVDGAFVYYVAQGEGHVERPRHIKYHAETDEDKAALAGQLVHALHDAGYDVEWGGDLGTAVRINYSNE